MAPTTTATVTRTSRSSRLATDGIIKPNVRPYGIEVVPDTQWRDWRMRELRQDLRETYPEMWPPINPALRARATEEIAQQRANDLPRERGFQRRSLADLDGYRATQLQFRSLEDIDREAHNLRLAAHPRKEYREVDYDKLPPFFFEQLSSDLFFRVWEFATDTFGHKDWAGLVNDRDWTGYWLSKLPAEFVRSASVVARGDRARGAKPRRDEHGYEYLFLEQHNRVNLCTAVIAKLLQENCFDALLFGATAEQKKALDLMDKSTDHIVDGYPRKLSRYDTIHQYLTSDLFTINFWPEVDRVTNGILAVLLPLINMIGEFDENHSVGNERALWPELTEVHQKLHNIVAEAAWLANGTSFSRSCFWTEFPQPGQLWDIRQEHVCDVSWNASSQAAKDMFTNSPAMTAWYAERDALFREIQAKRSLNMTLSEWTDTRYCPRHPKPRDPVRRVAKVQISMWPFFERYFPHRQNTANGGGQNSGDHAQTVQKAQVVYYAGDDSEEGERVEEYTLSQHLSDWKKRNTSYAVRLLTAAFALLPHRWVKSMFWVGFALVFFHVAQPGIRYGVDQLVHGQSVRPLGPGHFAPGHTAHGPEFNTHHPVDHHSRPAPLDDVLYQPDVHVGTDVAPVPTDTPGDHLEQKDNNAARHDASASQDDAPVAKHPLSPEDPTVTDTASARIASLPKAHEPEYLVSTETIPHDPRYPRHKTPSTVTVTHSDPPSQEEISGHREEFTVPVEASSPDHRQPGGNLSPGSLTGDKSIHDDVPSHPDVGDSVQKGRQEHPSRAQGLVSKLSTLISGWTSSSVGGRSPSAPPTHSPLEDDGLADLLSYLAGRISDGDAGDNNRELEYWKAFEGEFGHSAATKALEDVLEARRVPPETQEEMDHMRKELEAPLQFWRRFRERENIKDGGAVERTPASDAQTEELPTTSEAFAAQTEELPTTSEAFAAQPEDVPGTTRAPITRGERMLVRDTNRKLPPTAVNVEEGSKEGTGKAEETSTGKIEAASTSKAEETLMADSEEALTGKAEAALTSKAEETSTTKEEAALTSKAEETLTDKAEAALTSTAQETLTANSKEALTGKAEEVDPLTRKQVTTEVFGVRYNCWVVGGQAICAQTVTADGTPTKETSAATGDTILREQDL